MLNLKTYNFPDGCCIALYSNNNICINFQNESYQFDDKNKPVFDYETGETVIEYSGLLVDGNEKRSWASARYTPKAHAPLHYHNDLTEDYYIIQGIANVMVDDKSQVLSPGEHIQIKPKQHHQVLNLSDKEELVLIVKCAPSWIKKDYILVPYDEIEISNRAQSISFQK